jgi:hypothetical protein
MPAYDFTPTFMPLNLYVDEFSPDGVRATVSHPVSITANMLAFIKLGLVPDPISDKTINGIFILPTGKYVCLIVRSSNTTQRMADGMVFLDLTKRTEVIDEIAQKLGNAELEKKFLQTIDHIFNNPDTHSRFHLRVTKGGPLELFTT